MSVARNGSKNVFAAVSRLASSSSSAYLSRVPVTALQYPTWTCRTCHTRDSTTAAPVWSGKQIRHYQRTFSTSKIWRDKPASSTVGRDDEASRPPTTPTTAASIEAQSTELPPTPGSDHNVSLAAATPPPADQEKLPSHAKSKRSELSERLRIAMDDLLAKAAIAGQRLNTYTGTDYSGIENIRRQISELEQNVRNLHNSVASSKEAYTTAHAAQISAQKEVVSLLERKASWTPHDLDRYTSLIRSEHLHEGSVTEAKQKLSEVERELEEARTELEKKERRQYHEEQVWSDTIRRNSTWVTFGLMGLNILLLVTNIGIVEPWRRRRLVREVKDALDQKTLVAPVEGRREAVVEQMRQEPVEAPAAVAAVDLPAEVPVEVAAEKVDPEVEKQVDATTEPKGVSIEAIEGDGYSAAATTPEVEVKPEEATVVLEPPTTAPISDEVREGTWDVRVLEALQKAWSRTKEVYALWSLGPLSDETLVLRKVEVTSIALEGAATGLTVMGLLVWLLRGS